MKDIDTCSKELLIRMLTDQAFLKEKCQEIGDTPDELFGLFDLIPKSYRGIHTESNPVDTYTVYVDDKRLPIHHEIIDSVSVFEGEYGSGSLVQLGIAILADLLDVDQSEMSNVDGLLPRMVTLIITRLPRDHEWILTRMNIFHIISGVTTFEEELPQYCGGFLIEQVKNAQVTGAFLL